MDIFNRRTVFIKKIPKDNKSTVDFEEKSIFEGKKMHFRIKITLFKILCKHRKWYVSRNDP